MDGGAPHCRHNSGQGQHTGGIRARGPRRNTGTIPPPLPGPPDGPALAEVSSHDSPPSPAAPGSPEDAGAPRPGSLGRGLLRSARPKQWLKNLLVFAAPGAGGVLTEGPVLAEAGLAFVAFCLVASGTYFLNDARDAEADRAHPEKRHRPVAAGIVPVWLAVAVGVALLLAGFGVAALVRLQFVGVAAAYVAVTTSYTLWLKTVTVVDLAAVASGFIIRAVAGGVATDVPISEWFLIVASFGSLFMVSGKRHGEHIDLGEDRVHARSTLGEYSVTYLRYVWSMASGVTILAYCLWAFEQATKSPGGFPWYQLSIVPFVLAILRYAFLLETGKGATPEDVVLGDRTLQVISLCWLGVYAGGVYVAR